MAFTANYNVPQERVKKIVLEEHFCTPALIDLERDMEKSIASERWNTTRSASWTLTH